jgi:hypothetical protein
MKTTLTLILTLILAAGCTPQPDGTGEASCKTSEAEEPRLLHLDFYGDPEAIYGFQGTCRCIAAEHDPMVCEVDIEALALPKGE